MENKSRAADVKRSRDKKGEQGYVEVRAWVKREHRDEVREKLKKLIERVERSGTTTKGD